MEVLKDEEISSKDFLLKNPKWNKLSCLNNNENLKILLFYKKEFINENDFRNSPHSDVFLNCNQSLLEITGKFPKFQEKNELIAFCPQSCSISNDNFQNLEVSLINEDVFPANLSICRSAHINGMINDFYSGFVKLSLYSTNDDDSSITNNNKKYFIFEPLIGRIQSNEISSKKDPFAIFSKSFLEVSDKLDLGNIPTDILAKISQIMNQNSNEIIKQNHNIEELLKENFEFNKKIKEIDMGIENITNSINYFENLYSDLKGDLNYILKNQQNMNEIFQDKLENIEKNKNSDEKQNFKFQEDFSKVKIYITLNIIHI